MFYKNIKSDIFLILLYENKDLEVDMKQKHAVPIYLVLYTIRHK